MDTPAAPGPTGAGPAALDPTRSADDRRRAESFGRLAEAYDRVRPGYPDALVARVEAGLPPRPPARARLQVLDVGTGTGKLARLFGPDVDVVGSEVDPAMAAVARAHGLDVRVGPFEDFDADPGRFDRVVAGQAWHWIRPDDGLAAAARALAPGGQLWLLWNIGGPSGALGDALAAVYAEHAPQLSPASTARGGGGHAVDAVAGQVAGRPGVTVERVAVPWHRTCTGAQWVELLATYSDHSTLPPDVLSRLLARLAAVVDDHGGLVEVDYTAHAVVVDGLGS